MKGFGSRAALLLAGLAMALAAGASSSADGAPIFIPPETETTPFLQPAPRPVPSEGRIPVSVRLGESIRLADGSHPPAATEVRLDLDRHFRLDLSGVPRCPVPPPQGYPRFDWSSCAAAKVAEGQVGWDIDFLGEDSFPVGSRAVAYKTGTRKLVVRTFASTPVAGEVRIPLAIGAAPEPGSGVRLIASIPKVAGGSGSLSYLGMRFRKGLFSLACPQRGFDLHSRSLFADGTLLTVGLHSAC